jgi:hypothetical protein
MTREDAIVWVLLLALAALAIGLHVYPEPTPLADTYHNDTITIVGTPTEGFYDIM